ncbi:Membrane protein involved in the export of O-antigen and teichoic acid [Lachnospiraceae bacterium C7]|nr:Membrane protein involved in the export of O-antigen and teichoic acid [Lachnospiraceae bacterium C7]
MKEKSVKINAIMNSILSLSAFLFPLISTPYVSRVLGKVGVGKVGFCSTVVTYFSMFAQLGIPTYGIRVCAQHRDNKKELSRITQELIIINMVTVVLAYLSLAVAVMAVPKFYQRKEVIIVMSSIIILNALGVEWLYKALEEYSYITMRSIIFKIISLGLMFLLVRGRTYTDIVFYSGIVIFASSASNVLNMINLRKYVYLKPVWGYKFKRHMKPILIFFAMAVAGTIYTNLDKLMIGMMVDDSEVALYETAVKIKTILVSLVTSVSAVLLPRASVYVKEKKMDKFYEILEEVMNFTMIIATSFIIFFTLFAKEGIAFLGGKEFGAAIAPMQVIMPSIFFIAATSVIGYQLLIPLEMEKYVMYSSIVGAIVDLILNSILIPVLGATGASIGTVAAEISVLIVQFFALPKINIRLFKAVSFGKIILANALAFIAAFFVKYIPLDCTSMVQDFILMAIAATVYFGVYLIVLLVTREKLIIELVSQAWNTVLRRKK